MTLKGRLMAAINAFRNPPVGADADFESGRISRYEWFWRMYWNTAYDSVADYAANFAAGTKLYRFVRGLRNPLARWADFYVANVWGGMLDLAAGDGSREPSALPIVTESDALRPAIARLWQWSNWNSKRSLAMRYSAVCGDVFVKVVDKPDAARVFLQTVWPGVVADASWDDFGNLKRIIFQYRRSDERKTDNPNEAPRRYDYKEVIEHPSVWGGKYTRVRTYRNGGLYGFDENGNKPEWELPYDFVPCVHVPFMDVGSNWGAVGFARAIPEIRFRQQRRVIAG